MLKALILEDDHNRMSQMHTKMIGIAHLTIVETANEAIAALTDDSWDLLSLDHDLGGEEMVDSGPGTGYEVACWLENNPHKQPAVIWIHSLNPVGRNRMSQALPDAQQKPLWWKEE